MVSFNNKVCIVHYYKDVVGDCIVLVDTETALKNNQREGSPLLLLSKMIEKWFKTSPDVRYEGHWFASDVAQVYLDKLGDDDMSSIRVAMRDKVLSLEKWSKVLLWGPSTHIKAGSIQEKIFLMFYDQLCEFMIMPDKVRNRRGRSEEIEMILRKLEREIECFVNGACSNQSVEPPSLYRHPITHSYGLGGLK
jgi:hypothetical protein